VAKLYAHMPETVFTKEAELGGEERCLANFVDFIGEGRGSQALGRALVETVRRVDALREELNGLRRSREKVFQAPPVEWIEERLAQMKQVLERRTEHSALLLRSILGKIQLEPARWTSGGPTTWLGPRSTHYRCSSRRPAVRARTAVRIHCDGGGC